MAVANRFTNITPSAYNPRTLQELMVAPSYMRSQHDSLEKAAQELSNIQSNRLSTDESAVSDAISKFDAELNKYTDMLNKEGFSPSNKSYINLLNKKYKDLLSNEGIVGKAALQYNAYQENKKILDKQLADRVISPEKYQLGLKQALSDYEQSGGISKNAEYKPFIASPDQKVMERAREIALDLQKNPKKLTDFGLIKKGNRYYDTKNETEYTEKGAISYAIQLMLGQDQAISSDLMQREKLGIFGDKTAKEYLKNIGDTHEAFYSKNVTTKTQSGFYDPIETHLATKKLDEQLEAGGIDFENYTSTTTVLNNDSDINKLKNFINGKELLTTNKYLNRNSPGNVGAIVGMSREKAYQKPLSFEELDGNLKNKVTNIFEGLKRNGTLAPKAKIKDKKSLEAVVAHMEKNKDVTLTPKIIKPSLKKREEERQNIIENAEYREFYSVKDKRTYNYKQMVEKGYFTGNYKDDLANSIYNGQLSEDNDYSAQLPTSYGDTWNIPHVMKIHGRQFLVTPSESELKSSYNQTANKLHKEFVKLQYNGGLPIPYTWKYQDETGTIITRDIEVQLIKGNKYIVTGPSIYDNTIRQQKFSADEFKELLLDLTPKD